MKTSRVAVLALLLLFLPLASASVLTTTTWAGTARWTYNGTKSNWTQTTIGYGYTKQLDTFSFTNSSTAGTPGNCTKLVWLLEYDGTNTSWYSTTSQSLSTISAKVVKPYFNGTVSDVASGCAVSSVQLTWNTGGALDGDVIEGLPNVGSDIGGFMKNLAPGVGAFIIILGVFGGVGMLIYGVVGMIKGKIDGTV